MLPKLEINTSVIHNLGDWEAVLAYKTPYNSAAAQQPHIDVEKRQSSDIRYLVLLSDQELKGVK